MKSRVLIGAVMSLALVAGCTTANDRIKMAETHYKHVESVTSQKATQKINPLVQIVAKEGQTIKMEGVASFSVWAPVAADNTAQNLKMPTLPTLGEELGGIPALLLQGAQTYFGYKQGLAGIASAERREQNVLNAASKDPLVVTQPAPIIIETPAPEVILVPASP